MPRTIVHVDDDPVVLQLLATVLGRDGVRVVSVSNPLTAAKTIAENHPDLVICDISMPGKNGFEVIREIRYATPPVDCPVIFFSAMGDDVYLRMAMDLGAVDFVRKPASTSEIRARVKAWFAPEGDPARRQKHTVMRGQMDLLSVADMLRFFDLRRKSGIIKVWSNGERRGELHVSGSVVVNALDSQGSGEEAARRLLAVKSGEIEAVILDSVEARSGMQMPVSRLLGESLPPPPDEAG